MHLVAAVAANAAHQPAPRYARCPAAPDCSIFAQRGHQNYQVAAIARFDILRCQLPLKSTLGGAISGLRADHEPALPMDCAHRCARGEQRRVTGHQQRRRFLRRPVSRTSMGNARLCKIHHRGIVDPPCRICSLMLTPRRVCR